jgi:DNA-binding response OmpR family regulator
MRVLVVDDSEMVCRVLAAMIERLGHTALVAHTGADALAAEDYALVLLDQSLPDRPGTDVAREMRERGVAAPIYCISGHDDAVRSAREAGMDGHVPKPFRLEDVAAVLGVARAQTELGSAQLVQVMLRGILEEVPGLLEEARKTTDATEMRRIAHTIHGALRFIEAPRARDAAARVEQAAKNGVLDRDADEELRREVEALLPRLVRLLG